MEADIPPQLADWREAPRVRMLNARAVSGSSTRTDSAIRKRVGDEWIAQAAGRGGPTISIPDQPPVDPYLTGQLPI